MTEEGMALADSDRRDLRIVQLCIWGLVTIDHGPCPPAWLRLAADCC